jgi:succinate-acetate transporter protein
VAQVVTELKEPVTQFGSQPESIARIVVKEEVQWANPGALGLAGFGLNTILLQIHNIGWIESTLPLIFGFFWGGVAQVIAGIIDARRGDTFGLTAFVSYGLFWLGLSFSFLLQWMGLVKLDNSGLAWLFVMWGIFTGYMTLGTLKMTWMHLFVFATLTVLFFLLAAHFFGAVAAIVPGIEGLFCGAAAVYGSAAVIVNAKYGREVFPLGKVIR